MQRPKSFIYHQPVSEKDVLGFDGYNIQDVFCVRANGDGNFLEYGIAENSILFVDKSMPFQDGKLSLFLTGSSETQKEPYKVSNKKIKGAEHLGRIVMSVNQFA